jgi:hypothetical protein
MFTFISSSCTGSQTPCRRGFGVKRGRDSGILRCGLGKLLRVCADRVRAAQCAHCLAPIIGCAVVTLVTQMTRVTVVGSSESSEPLELDTFGWQKWHSASCAWLDRHACAVCRVRRSLGRDAFLLAFKGSAAAFRGTSPGATPPSSALVHAFWKG